MDQGRTSRIQTQGRGDLGEQREELRPWWRGARPSGARGLTLGASTASALAPTRLHPALCRPERRSRGPYTWPAARACTPYPCAPSPASALEVFFASFFFSRR